jgi:RNA polymerase sigma-70 factor (ECF subfamily)
MKSGPGPEARPGLSREQMEDKTLLARVAARDAEAFRALLDRHLGGVLALARRMLHDDAEAEDVAQEAMLRLWRQGGSVEVGPQGLGPWLRRVAANMCIDRLRSGKRAIAGLEMPEEAIEADQHRVLEGKDVAARVAGALQTLPERQRQALTLFHYEGLSLIEVATSLGISGEAVESLLARARRSLRAQLKEDWRRLLQDGT